MNSKEKKESNENCNENCKEEIKSNEDRIIVSIE